MNWPEWLNRATPVEAVTVAVGFLSVRSFYHGPENGFSPEQWQQLREPLYQPQVDRYGDFVLSQSLVPSAGELIRYYQDVLQKIAAHGKKVDRQRQYFWLRPLLFSPGAFAIAFPWYDTWQEAVPVLDALTADGEGELFQDEDQGWGFVAYAEGDRLFLRQSDPDTDEEYGCIACSRQQVADQVPELRQRMTRLLEELRGALGADYWSKR